jgi:DNA primase
MIDTATINRILDTAEIIDVIQEFVTLKKRGVNYVGLCPFHNEKTPSFNVSQSKGIFKCFGCGKGGNVVNFLMEHEKLSYPEALKYLARKYHIEIAEREETAEDIAQKNEIEGLLIVTSFAQKYFSEIMLHTPEGRAVGLAYFKERGFRDDII